MCVTQHSETEAGAGLEDVWRVPDEQVRSGRIPGYVGAVRIGGQVHVRAGGRVAVEPGSAPMREDTLFRIASTTKPVGAALVLGLVQDGAADLDEPVARWLPEMASPRVLADPAGPLDNTVPARRAVTLRHLLTMTCGWGAVLEPSPLEAAMREQGVSPGPLTPPMSGDEFVARVAGLPLAFQPGEGWLYDTGMDLAGILAARAAGRPLSDLLAERITGPLGMTSTGFVAADASRLATAYRPGPDGLTVLDPPDGAFAAPPHFEELSSGLVSTAPDLLRFFGALADGGGPVLTGPSVALMTADALTGAQREQALPILGPGRSWGLGTAVDIEAAQPWMVPGRWGWDGGTGTTARVDPERGTVGVLLTQRAMTGPLDGFDDFWAAVAAGG
jgi:CubicO group peptidase (beta-lactamase class C family)